MGGYLNSLSGSLTSSVGLSYLDVVAGGAQHLLCGGLRGVEQAFHRHRGAAGGECGEPQPVGEGADAGNLGETLGQQFVVDNRGGAGTKIGTFKVDPVLFGVGLGWRF